jgi:myo-inositol-1(or 4)-monophosphatase
LADVNAGSAQHQIQGREILARDAALLSDAVREAGALALSLFGTELKNWTKGASSPVSEADIRVNDLLESRLRTATPD